MRFIGAHACIDITGFGLVGQAAGMAEASRVTIELIASVVPLIGPTLRLAESGVLTRAWKNTLESLGLPFHSEGVADALVGVLSDAQTSGGLLIAVAPDRTDSARSDLMDKHPCLRRMSAK